MPRITNKEERNLKIIKFLEHHDWSFQLVADKFGVTRNAVAGIMFRHNHPYKTRVCSPGSQSKNKIGGGYRGFTRWPATNARNSSIRGAI